MNWIDESIHLKDLQAREVAFEKIFRGRLGEAVVGENQDLQMHKLSNFFRNGIRNGIAAEV